MAYREVRRRKRLKRIAQAEKSVANYKALIRLAGGGRELESQVVQAMKSAEEAKRPLLKTKTHCVSIGGREEHAMLFSWLNSIETVVGASLDIVAFDRALLANLERFDALSVTLGMEWMQFTGRSSWWDSTDWRLKRDRHRRYMQFLSDMKRHRAARIDASAAVRAQLVRDHALVPEPGHGSPCGCDVCDAVVHGRLLPNGEVADPERRYHWSRSDDKE